MLGQLYLEATTARFEKSKLLAENAMAQLNFEELVVNPSKESNSIATIVKHLHGNMLSRWTDFLTTDGEKSWRKRDAEFKDTYPTRAALEEDWQKGWQVVFKTLQELTDENLSQIITIRQEEMSVIDAIQRQVDHYGYHIGLYYINHNHINALYNKFPNWFPKSSGNYHFFYIYTSFFSFLIYSMYIDFLNRTNCISH